MRRWSRTALVLGVASALTVTPSLQTAAGTAPGEFRMFNMVNASRSSQGISRLSLSDRLSRMARRHSRRMARELRLFHHSCLACRFPSGSVLGENVGTATSLRRIHRLMMNSAAHRGVLLNGAFDRVGIGVVKRGRTYWVTEIFHA